MEQIKEESLAFSQSPLCPLAADVLSDGESIYFYMYDLDSYREELRGFYIDIYSDLPGDIYEDEEAMLKDIREGNFDRERLSQFNARFNEHEDGHASQRVIDIVFGEERS